MEDTAKLWHITRTEQDHWAYRSHRRAASSWAAGFFDDLVVALPELAKDANVRSDTSLEKLAFRHVPLVQRALSAFGATLVRVEMGTSPVSE